MPSLEASATSRLRPWDEAPRNLGPTTPTSRPALHVQRPALPTQFAMQCSPPVHGGRLVTIDACWQPSGLELTRMGDTAVTACAKQGGCRQGLWLPDSFHQRLTCAMPRCQRTRSVSPPCRRNTVNHVVDLSCVHGRNRNRNRNRNRPASLLHRAWCAGAYSSTLQALRRRPPAHAMHAAPCPRADAAFLRERML